MVDGKEEPVSSRKIQKAEREKIRRDKLKKHVFELGDALGILSKKNCFFFFQIH